MTAPQNPIIRDAMRVRESGELGKAVAMLRGAVDPADPQAGLVHLRLLFEVQDYATLQAETVRAIRALTPEIAATAGTEYLVTLLHFAERCCLPVAMIEAATKRVTEAARRDPALLSAWRATRHRQRFRRNLEARYAGRASIVSLGLNCLPWHLPGRWGLRSQADFTRLFVPFSLAGHTADGVANAVADDFATYCTPETVRAVTSQRGHEFAMRKDRGGFWNHNRGTYWLKDDMAALRENCATKAAAFRAAARRADVVFLLATCPVEYPQEPLDFLPRLQEALSRHTGTTENRILITNQTARRATPGYRRVDDSVAFAYCPYPAQDYVWHDDDVADGQEGLTFERRYMSFLLRALVNWGLLTRQEGADAGDDVADAA
jgi:hypothetical protein